MTKIKLPPISDEDRQHLYYNPNTDDLVDWITGYATQAVTEDRAQCDADHLAELRAYELTVSNLREQLEQHGEPANTVTATAPKEIWLQVSDEISDCNDPFPTLANDDGVTWCQDSVQACEVHYIRADLAQQAPQMAQPDNLEQIIDDYVDDYAMEGDGGTYRPTESEKCLLKDAVMGLLADPAWNSAWGEIVEGSKQAPQVPTDTQPAWHDAPTEAGLWVNSTSGRVNVVIEETLHAWQDTGARWLGPLPEDTK